MLKTVLQLFISLKTKIRVFPMAHKNSKTFPNQSLTASSICFAPVGLALLCFFEHTRWTYPTSEPLHWIAWNAHPTDIHLQRSHTFFKSWSKCHLQRGFPSSLPPYLTSQLYLSPQHIKWSDKLYISKFLYLNV